MAVSYPSTGDFPEENDMKDPSDEPISPSALDFPALIEQVGSLIRSIAGYVHLTPEYRRRINTAATLPDEFYLLGSLVLDTNEWLATTSSVTGDEVRDVRRYSAGVLELAHELELLAKGLRSTAAAQRGSIGERLLFAYSVARRHQRSPEFEQVIPHIQQMEAILRERRRGRRKQAKNAPEEPAALDPGEQPA